MPLTMAKGHYDMITCYNRQADLLIYGQIHLDHVIITYIVILYSSYENSNHIFTPFFLHTTFTAAFHKMLLFKQLERQRH